MNLRDSILYTKKYLETLVRCEVSFMELKNYQKNVMNNLQAYLVALKRSKSLDEAWNFYWRNQDIAVGLGGVPAYNNTIDDVPHICMKVPTGGGKTLLACASLYHIFNELEINQNRVVVWLAPSDSIMQQTISALSNPSHPYRQKLNHDFANRVEILTKEMLLSGTEFAPDTIKDTLTICVLSYDSLRIDSKKKDVRKVYQENGNLKGFAEMFQENKSELLSGTADTALIQAIRHLKPVTIVDESHNANSPLSTEMLNNLNPSFVLDLTATPKQKSNIIVYVDARDLKKENMVKLPVVVYNRASRKQVFQDAIQLRARLEQIANEEEKISGKHIRPIVLFQAQPNTKTESQTFEKVKEILLGIGVPEEEIAIKTSDVDELKGVDLLSKDCQIHYIITVNALKEGWDCPFAYILASLANKTSRVDVEQIVGRILRQPYACKSTNALLNTSYVLTCSSIFHDTLEQVVKGLNNAGFSRKDYRVAENKEGIPNTPVSNEQLSLSSDAPSTIETNESQNTNEIINKDDDISNEISQDVQKDIKNALVNANGHTSVSDFIKDAEKEIQNYDQENNNSSELNRGELGEMLKQNIIQEEFTDIKDVRLPVFMVDDTASMFDEGTHTPLTYGMLEENFNLSKLEANIKFELSEDEMYSVDISDKVDNVPKYQRATLRERKHIQEMLESLPPDKKIAWCEGMITNIINKDNAYSTNQVAEYVHRVVTNMSNEELACIEQAYPAYAEKIRDSLKEKRKKYREKQFLKMIDAGEITTQPHYRFPAVITPADTIESIPKSLYEAEKNDMNNFEWDVINTIVSQPNVRWWHRVIDRKGFYLNGFINHYPDFIIQTKSGKIILLETKGEQLANDDSRDKIEIGKKWAYLSGRNYRYFMVFKNKGFKDAESNTLDEFISILKRL